MINKRPGLLKLNLCFTRTIGTGQLEQKLVVIKRPASAMRSGPMEDSCSSALGLSLKWEENDLEPAQLSTIMVGEHTVGKWKREAERCMCWGEQWQ